MNRKGFTLIELITTIALLAIIALIAFVTITKVIEKSKVSNCNSLVSNINKAASEYVSDHRYDSSFVRNVKEQPNGEYTGTITANTLISGKYLQAPIVNPFTNEKITDGTNGTPNEQEAIQIYLTLNSDFTLSSSNIGIDDTNVPSVDYERLKFLTTCEK